MDKGTIVRLVMMVLAYVNVLLAAHNYKTIQLDEKTVSVLVAIAISGYGFYKHNFFGKKGKALKDEIVKVSEAVIEKVVEAKVAPAPQPEVKPEPVVVSVAPSNQPIAPVAQPEQPTVPTETK